MVHGPGFSLGWQHADQLDVERLDRRGQALGSLPHQGGEKADVGAKSYAGGDRPVLPPGSEPALLSLAAHTEAFTSIAPDYDPTRTVSILGDALRAINRYLAALAS
jgi:hypothetical protein